MFTGPDLASVGSPTTFDSTHIVGSITLLSIPTPGSFLSVDGAMVETEIAAFSFSVGPLSIDQNSDLDIRSFFLIFDASGDIVDWTISLVNMTPPAPSMILTSRNGGDTASAEVAGETATGMAAATTSVLWVMVPEPVPGLLLGLALAGLLAAHRRA